MWVWRWYWTQQWVFSLIRLDRYCRYSQHCCLRNVPPRGYVYVRARTVCSCYMLNYLNTHTQILLCIITRCYSWLILDSLTQVYMFLDKMSFYTEVYKHKPSDVLSREDETLWRRQTPKLLYPLGQWACWSVYSLFFYLSYSVNAFRFKEAICKFVIILDNLYYEKINNKRNKKKTPPIITKTTISSKQLQQCWRLFLRILLKILRIRKRESVIAMQLIFSLFEVLVHFLFQSRNELRSTHHFYIELKILFFIIFDSVIVLCVIYTQISIHMKTGRW